MSLKMSALYYGFTDSNPDEKQEKLQLTPEEGVLKFGMFTRDFFHNI